MADAEALILALQNRKQVTLTYEKATTGENVTHTGGIHEIGVNSRGAEVLWLWDTTLDDHIRQFLLSNIVEYQVLDLDYIPSIPYPLKLNGQII